MLTQRPGLSLLVCHSSPTGTMGVLLFSETPMQNKALKDRAGGTTPSRARDSSKQIPEPSHLYSRSSTTTFTTQVKRL